MERAGLLQSIITQNIDNLHQEAGSQTVYEFHGTSRTLACINCGRKVEVSTADLNNLPPTCPTCGGILKPDFVFLENPFQNLRTHFPSEKLQARMFLVVGTTGEIMPASVIPHVAKRMALS